MKNVPLSELAAKQKRYRLAKWHYETELEEIDRLRAALAAAKERLRHKHQEYTEASNDWNE